MNSCKLCHQELPNSSNISLTVHSNGQGDIRNLESQKSDKVSLLQRFIARFIDYQLIFLMYITFNHLTHGTVSSDITWFSRNISSIPTQTLTTLLLSLLFVGYFIIFHSTGGQTPGKYICSIRVGHSRKPTSTSIFQNIIRETILLFCLMLGGWPFIIMLFSKKKRGLHDWITLTTVKKV